MSRAAIVALLTLWAGLSGPAYAEPGATFPELTVKGVVFRDVRVVSQSASALTVRHAGGLAQIQLRDLSPELQQRFGFDPRRAAAAEQQIAKDSAAQAEVKRRELEAAAAAPRPSASRTGNNAVERALARFGTPAEFGRVDLRPRFRELELVMKDQGFRPSCSVFAVVGALELQNALVAGRTEKLSEEYLIWATRHSLGLDRVARPSSGDAEAGDDAPKDAGFALSEVVGALRTYGIPLQSDMPNMRVLALEKIAPPAEEVVHRARTRRQVFAHPLTGRDNSVRIANIVHALNEGVPVAIGLRWPRMPTLKAALISTQTPVQGYAHAVTLVGYYNDSGVPDETRFIFRNSWGMSWGAGGYGFVELRYLREHLLDGVLLEVRPAAR